MSVSIYKIKSSPSFASLSFVLSKQEPAILILWFDGFRLSSSAIYQPMVATATAVVVTTTTITISLRPCCLMNQRSGSLFSIGLIKTN